MNKPQIHTALLIAPLLSLCLQLPFSCSFPYWGLCGRLDLVRTAGVHLVCRRSDFCPDQVRLPVKVTELTRVLQHTGFSRATLIMFGVLHVILMLSIFISKFIESFFLKVTILLCIYPYPSAIPVRIQLATFHDDRSHHRWREREPGMCHLFCQPVFPITPLTPPLELTELWTYWQSASFPSAPSSCAPPTILSD